MDKTWLYFQYRKNHQYPVFLRIQTADLNPKFSHLFQEMGFAQLADTESKKISLQKAHTRILSIQHASPRVQMQINVSDLDRYGNEVLSLQQGLPVYCYRKVGLMAFPMGKTLWDLAIHQDISTTEQMVGFRAILVRYLAQSLSEMGVLCYWGTMREDHVLIMKQTQSFGEAVLIDLAKKVIFSNGGELKIGSSLKIIRKDKDVRVAAAMGREELISFLSVSTCLLSFSGLTPSMRKSIYDLSLNSTASYGVSDHSVNL